MRPHRVTLLLTLLFLLPNAAADETYWLWKVYAGETTVRSISGPDKSSEPAVNLPSQIRQEIRRNIEEDAAVPDLSVINCTSNNNFGIVYYVIFEGARTANFDLTWQYPHLEKEIGRASHSRAITARMQSPGLQNRWQLRQAFWGLEKDELKDGDFVLVLHRGDTVLLYHVFQVRGCESLGNATGES